MTTPPRPTALSLLMKCWRKRNDGLARADESLLDFLAARCAEKRIGHYDVKRSVFLEWSARFSVGVLVWTMLGASSMQDHVHDGEHVGERFLFLANECSFLECFEIPWW